MSRELKDQRATLISQARAMLDVAEGENRDLTAEEQTQYDAKMVEIEGLEVRIDRAERLASMESELSQVEPRRNSALPGAPNYNRKTGLGDNEIKATAHYIKHGDVRALAGLDTTQESDFIMAASNATDMSTGSAGAGSVLVPTGHYAGIIGKRAESALFGPLGVTPYNDLVGTTANVPTADGGNVFVSTAETPGPFDQDSPLFSSVAMTLVDFTKDLVLTNDLREMSDVGLLDFLTRWVGQALALTHNSALVTEVLADGTSVALGTAAAATAGDPETMEGALQAEYADNAYFLMSRATLFKYRKLTGSPFLYQTTPAGFKAPQSRQLGESLSFMSSFMPAVGAGNKSIAFGDFSFVGMRETPLTFLYDPYSKASTGRVVLHYYTRIVYKVTNADAILYGKHPTA